MNDERNDRDRDDLKYRDLLARLARLPEEAEPERDLWPLLAERIRGERETSEAAPAVRRPNRVWRGLALAASLLLTLGVGFEIGRRIVPTEPPPAIAETVESAGDRATVAAGASDRTVLNAMSDAEHALLVVKRELRSSLDRYRGALSPETARALDANLETIERSILELQRAIEANPESTELRRALMSYHENEIALLKRVTRAASRL